MGGLTFAGLLRDAHAQRNVVPAAMDIDVAKRTVDDWLAHIRIAVSRSDSSALRADIAKQIVATGGEDLVSDVARHLERRLRHQAAAAELLIS